MSTIAPWIEKFPKKVWVAAQEFAVVFAPRDHPRLKDAEGEYDGDTDWATYQITLRADINNLAWLLETVFHEITHIVNDAGKIEDGAIEEEIADQHGKLWSQFWVNNPAFQRWHTAACVAQRKERAGLSLTTKKRRTPTAEAKS